MAAGQLLVRICADNVGDPPLSVQYNAKKSRERHQGSGRPRVVRRYD